VLVAARESASDGEPAAALARVAGRGSRTEVAAHVRTAVERVQQDVE
jgi:hypothetical protein